MGTDGVEEYYVMPCRPLLRTVQQMYIHTDQALTLRTAQWLLPYNKL